MKLLESLVDAIVRLEGDALVMHVGEKPYVVTTSASMNAHRGPLAWGQVELSSRILTSEAVDDMLTQILPPADRQTLQEYGAVEHVVKTESEDDRFTVVAARGGQDIWLELRRHRPQKATASSSFIDLAPRSGVERPEPYVTEPSVEREQTQTSATPAKALPRIETVEEEQQGVPTEEDVDAMLGATAAALLTSDLGTGEIVQDDSPGETSDTAVYAGAPGEHDYDDETDEEVELPIDDLLRPPAGAAGLPLQFPRAEANAPAAHADPVSEETQREPPAASASIPPDLGTREWDRHDVSPPPVEEIVSRLRVIASASRETRGDETPDAGHVAAAIGEHTEVAAGRVEEAASAHAEVVARDPAESVPVRAEAEDARGAEPVPVFSEPAARAAEGSVRAQGELEARDAPESGPAPGDTVRGEAAENYESPASAAMKHHAEVATRDEPRAPVPVSVPVDTYAPVRNEPSAAATPELESSTILESPRPDAHPPSTQPVAATGPRPVAVPSERVATQTDGQISLSRTLRTAAERGASIVYVVAQSRPVIRVNGEITVLEDEPLVTAADVERVLADLAVPGPHDRPESEAPEWMCDVPDIGRVRYLTFRDHRGPGLIFRMTPPRSISAEQLDLSPEVQALVAQPDGLIVVTGVRASGKSTLSSAFVDLINRTRSDHVITIESQIAFVHESQRSFISQREVRGNSGSIAGAVRRALHEDPDVLFVEELASADVLDAVLEATEEGRLVFGSVHAPSATAAVDQIMELFPAERRAHARTLLAASLRGVVAQVLLRKIGGGRVAAREVLINTPAVASAIIEGKTFQMQGRRQGMVPLNDALAALVRDGTVHIGEAYRKAVDRDALLAMLKREGVDTSFAERLA